MFLNKIYENLTFQHGYRLMKTDEEGKSATFLAPEEEKRSTVPFLSIDSRQIHCFNVQKVVG